VSVQENIHLENNRYVILQLYEVPPRIYISYFSEFSERVYKSKFHTQLYNECGDEIYPGKEEILLSPMQFTNLFRVIDNINCVLKEIQAFRYDIGEGLYVMGENCFPLILIRDSNREKEGGSQFNRGLHAGIGLHTSEWKEFNRCAQYIMKRIEERGNYNNSLSKLELLSI